jgi:methylase of polypeptide subunit release factors
MELIEKILRQAKNFLKPGGMLYVEHEPEQENLIKEILPNIIFHKDQFGLVRFSVYKN